MVSVSDPRCGFRRPIESTESLTDGPSGRYVLLSHGVVVKRQVSSAYHGMIEKENRYAYREE